MLMAPHLPLGGDGYSLRSQIAEENLAVEPNSIPSNPSNNLEDNATIVGLVADAGVPIAAVPLVTTATTRVVRGRSRQQPVTQQDFLSYIERSCQRQPSSLTESFGNVLNSAMNPPRPAMTMSDITRDFCSTNINLNSATGVAIKFWTIACDNLIFEMRAFTGDDTSLASSSNRNARRSAD
mmetsp:Transcript_11009/g.13022  ORF Transcript_11009/g.13022 Transcript_11009/m.13022 type:complete len:181 (-) Transcript_11009:62-604(-)|eukprot:CAMPEP_0198278206 /NCGR_PEP_ID=MMETSP1447-20131203/66258_1 /TAXON_ID=420782 /ORGANISM="Chaetoceros dichaeta, Strain CCMP1751" /LENGTH=180 /DNA_ID=CAMNT_0043973277 /DNA_START=567 /DNA_END=1109 /DNA_ORIENTATION=+